MEKRIKKHSALCMMITLVDENNGSVDINNGKVKKVFNDENEIVMIEYSNGEVALLADADYDTINDSILKWKSDNPHKFSMILNGMR